MWCGDIMKVFLQDFIRDNIKMISILTLCMVIGLIVGIFMYQMISPGVRSELINSMKSTLDLSKQEGFEGINIIRNGMISNLILVLIIYLMSLTLISPYLISILSLFKGLAIGIYIPTLLQIFGPSKGVLAIFLLVIIPNLVYIPSYLFLCTNSIRFHLSLIGDENKFTVLMKESFKIMLGFSIMFVGVILEQLTSFWIIALYHSI